MYWITGAGDKRPHERWAAPDGSVSGGRNLAILPLHGRVFLGKAKIPLGFAIHLGSRKVSGKWGRGRHKCPRHLWNQWSGTRFLESAVTIVAELWTPYPG